MTTTVYGYGVRQRQKMPARHLPAELPERMRINLANAERVLAEPYRGITTDGQVRQGLFRPLIAGSTRPIHEAAEAFLASLSPEQREAACFPIDSLAWQKWSNIHPFTMRHGVLLEELDDARRELAMQVLRASLSARGYQTSRDIMKLNYTIGEITGSWEEYGDWVYWLSIFGSPSDNEPWGWQIDGHHLIINCFVLGDAMVLTPVFMGSEPVHALTGKYAGTRVLEQEESIGLELIRALTPDQQRKAMPYAEASEGANPMDGRLKAGAQRDNLILPYEGIAAAELSDAQRALLLDVIATYVGHMRDDHASARMQEVRSHLDETFFLWMGGTDEDAVYYYRLHSPVILIEFDHQRGVAFDNDTPSRNHIHTIVRTPNGNDYGKDLLRQHYETHHHAK